MNKIIGIIFVVVGIVLLVRGHNIAQSIDSQVKNIFTGTPTHEATCYYAGGVALCAIGLFQIFWPFKK